MTQKLLETPPLQSLLPTTLAGWRDRLWRAFALLPALGFLAIVLAPPLNHDVAAVLNFAERMWDGEALYSQLIDVNPPLIFLLNLPAIALSRLTDMDTTQALLATVLLLCALVWRLCAALRRGREGPVEAAMLAALLPLLLVVAGYDFAQREQLMAISAIPYLLLAERRMNGIPTGRTLAWGATILAALGFALKPHFLATPALVEALVLAVALRQRGWVALREPTPWLLAAVWALYLAAIPVFFPDYFGHVVPLVWEYYVDLGGAPWWRVLLTPTMGSAAALSLGLCAFALRPGGGWLPRILAMALLGGMAAAIVQHKGWSYHLIPVWIWGGLLCGVMAARWADAAVPAARAARSAPLLAAAACFALAIFTLRGGEAPWTEINFQDGRTGHLTAWLKREAHGERLLVLSPDISPVYPSMNYAQAQSVLPFMSTWLLQSTNQSCPDSGARYREPWEMSRAEFFVYRIVAERFAREPPAAVLVSRYTAIPWCGNAPFDFIEYFSRHPLFAEAWKRYRPKGEIDGYLLFARED